MFRVLLLTVALGIIPPAPSTQYIPFIETFHQHGKTLIYVAADHHSPVKYPDAMADPTFRTIESVFKESRPDAVIVEGAANPEDIKGLLEHVADVCNPPNYGCGESEFAAFLAARAGATVISGEPTANVELAAFEARGYSVDDYLATKIMSNIPPAKRRGDLTEQSFRQLEARVVAQEEHVLQISVPFTADDFARWYSSHMATPRNYLDIQNEDANPYPPSSEPKTLFHTLAALSVAVRDASVVAAIKSALQTHDRVLVVYGASHLDFEWDDLVRLMGAPTKSKPY